MSQSKYWCFTINNPTQEDEMDNHRHEDVTYVIYQQEKGANETLHIQGYIEFRNKKRLAWLKRHINERAHWELRQGTAQQAADYCRKETFEDADQFEWGEISQTSQGKRTDIEDMKHFLDEETRAEDAVADFNFALYLRYRKSLIAYMNLKVPARDFKTKVWVFTGFAGTGKSRLAHQLAATRLWLSPKTKWFDGYNGTDDILFDDFYGTIPAHQMLNILDEYECLVEKKGGTISLRAKNIFITSNKPWNEWYQEARCDFAALERRLDVCLQFLDRDEDRSRLLVEKASDEDHLMLKGRADLLVEN